MDPLCEKYYNISPYSYCAGNPIRYVDPDGRKIQVIGSDEYRSWVLSTLQKLTDDKLSMNSKGYISITKNVNGKLSTGTGLLRETISNKHTAFVRKGDNSESSILLNGRADPAFGYQKMKYDNENDPYNGKGTDVNITLTPGKHSEALVSSNSNGPTVKEDKRPEYVGAAHEIIHGLRDMKGEAVPNASVGYDYIDQNEVSRHGQASLEELQTVGISGNYRYTENKIRAEHGLPLRRNYR